ncbi:unnamed protein product [Rhodiola kirilowii]
MMANHVSNHSEGYAFPSPRISFLADKCASINQLKQIQAQAMVTARIHDNYAVSRLLSFCAVSESGDVHYAMKLFRSVQEPNSFMWNTMIRAQAGGINPKGAIFLYLEMRRADVVPGKHTFPFLLKACSKFGSLSCCRQVHGQVVKLGLDFDAHVGNGLIRCYSVASDLVDARKVFDEMTDRNVTMWTSLITGYAQNFCSNEALILFDRMIAEGLEPNGATLASVLSACARSGALELGERVHTFMKDKQVQVGVILGTALVHMYAKNGAMEMAKDLFNCMEDTNIMTWNSMICGLATHGHAKEAIELFQKLVSEQIVPNGVTFVGVLTACCHAGLLDTGREYFNLMKTVYQILPGVEHYGCMVDLLGRSGQLHEAEKLISDMRCKPDVVVWGALLAGCKSYGNIEIAERAVKGILELEPENHGVYVVLSNMYAEAGRWEDVSRLRTVMKQENLNKLHGWSVL